MATIDERAEEFGKQECGENCIFICEEWKDKNGVCSRLASRAALYKSIATEQRAIDIDKACEWLESHFRDIENPDFYSRRNHPTDLESMYHWSVKELVADFRKAMEG